MEGCNVSALTPNGHSIWAIVDDHGIWRYDDEWRELGQIRTMKSTAFLQAKKLFAGTFAAHVYHSWAIHFP
ncbi:MAG: hypothetical protein CM1200mP9_04690 [Gammaproteobacteria bacterium]|nr:MAG: hypothetical protein CM1200mP9_04690 [Gammaproteobacteria bacterium]